MSNYKNFYLRQLGLKESSIPLQNNLDDPNIGNEEDKKKPEDQSQPSGLDRMMSPTAIATPVIGFAVRGSSTGGLPSGLDQTGIPSNTPTGRLGGYEPIPPAKDNSKLVNKTPVNNTITSDKIKADAVSADNGDGHPHQIQQSSGEPQSITGASTDSSNALKVSDGNEQGEVDISVAEEKCTCNPGEECQCAQKECADCGCGDSSNTHDKLSTDNLREIKKSLQEKAISGKMNKQETKLFAVITEVLQKRTAKK